MFHKANFIDRVKLVLLLFLIWGSALLFLSINNYFVGFYGGFHLSLTDLIINNNYTHSTQGLLFEILIIISVVLLIYPFQINLKESRVYLIFIGIKKLVDYVRKGNFNNSLNLTDKEKTSLLIFCVKFTFLPLLVNFTYHNIKSLLFNLNYLSKDIASILTLDVFCNYTFKVLFYLILTIDTLFFVFGYLIESKKLKSTIKSVDSTLFGWIVALACYPPYNIVSSNFLGWHSSDFATSNNLTLNTFLSVFSLIFFTIYLLATINLGAKASNMTNRGIVSKGMYSIVRHPAYIAKNLAWWVMGIPFILKYGIVSILSLIAWSFIYYLRAITEEKHLSKDEEYINYIKKVPYRFIPGLI